MTAEEAHSTAGVPEPAELPESNRADAFWWHLERHLKAPIKRGLGPEGGAPGGVACG
jgi:hypothetical protein